MFGAANTLVGSASGYANPARHEVATGAVVQRSNGLEGGIYPADVNSNLAFIGSEPGAGRTEVHVAFLVLAALGVLVGMRSLGFRSVIAVSR